MKSLSRMLDKLEEPEMDKKFLAFDVGEPLLNMRYLTNA